MKKILLFPGAFNPPHLGHVGVLVKVAKRYAFDEIWILPSGNRGDKLISTTYEHRKELNQLFVEYLKDKIPVPVLLRLDELEDSENRTTEEVLKRIKSNSDVDMTQLIGIDGYKNLRDSLEKNEKFIIVNRPGLRLDDLVLRGGDMFIEEAVSGISSTEIRNLIKNNNLDFENMVPPEIAWYIRENNLYQ